MSLFTICVNLNIHFAQCQAWRDGWRHCRVAARRFASVDRWRFCAWHCSDSIWFSLAALQAVRFALERRSWRGLSSDLWRRMTTWLWETVRWCRAKQFICYVKRQGETHSFNLVSSQQQQQPHEYKLQRTVTATTTTSSSFKQMIRRRDCISTFRCFIVNSSHHIRFVSFDLLVTLSAFICYNACFFCCWSFVCNYC